MSFIDFVFQPENVIFTVSLFAMFALIAFEIIMTMVGFSTMFGDADFDVDADVDANGSFVSVFFNWINPHGIPVMALLLLFLTLFNVIGFSAQYVVNMVLNFLPNSFMSGPFVMIFSFVGIRYLSKVFSALIPKDENFAVSIEKLVDKVGEVVLPAKDNLLGTIKVTDEFGSVHYIQYFSEDEMNVGDHAILVSYEPNTVHTFEAKKIN